MEGQRLAVASAHQDDALKINWLADEAVKTSAIEGEALNRDSVQQSLMRRLGLTPPEARRHGSAEEGIAGLIASLYGEAPQPLSHDILCNWHYMPMGRERYVITVGDHRRYGDPKDYESAGAQAAGETSQRTAA